MKDNTALTRHMTVGAIVVAYQETCATIRRAFADLVDAERNLNLALQTGGEFHTGGVKLCADRNYQSRFDDPEECIKRLRHNVWDQIVVKLELQKFLSVGKWRELNDLIDNDQMPDIDEESVNGFLRGLIAQRQDLLADAVRETFEFLRPRGWSHGADYKTNTQFEIGTRVVLTWMVEPGLTPSKRQLRYDQRQAVLAMERVFQMLAGDGEINPSHYSELDVAIRERTEGETSWFRYRACKNGNLHLEFKRRDLLKRFNQIAGGARLRPTAAGGVQTGSEMAVAS